jgi:toxin ParE1/3/4
MKLVYTEQALKSLEESLEFISPQVTIETLKTIRNNILDRADKLVENPSSGKREEYLEHLGLDHRRVIESHYKIVYRVIDKTVYITDIFDSRQDPKKMKG